MRLLMVGLLVSLGVLLIAAAGVARHIWLRRGKHGSQTQVAASAAEKIDPEVEP